MPIDKLKYCVLTAYQFPEPKDLFQLEGFAVTYHFAPVGKVVIAVPTLHSLLNSQQYDHPIVAGICRNAFEKGHEPPMITTDFLENSVKGYPYPKTFKEKASYLLKFLYEKGGNEHISFDLSPGYDYPVCYSSDPEEFTRIVEHLGKSYLAEWGNVQHLSGGRKRFFNVQLTNSGLEEVEKSLPNIPMVGLVDQSITTGDIEVDNRINHAKDLFFQAPQTWDRMRSACETLSYVLEPLRQDVKKYFNSRDTEDFFQLVNNFDIRHNKQNTKELEHPEQLEWVFYALLNTINTYTKLKKRLA